MTPSFFLQLIYLLPGSKVFASNAHHQSVLNFQITRDNSSSYIALEVQLIATLRGSSLGIAFHPQYNALVSRSSFTTSYLEVVLLLVVSLMGCHMPNEEVIQRPHARIRDFPPPFFSPSELPAPTLPGCPSRSLMVISERNTSFNRMVLLLHAYSSEIA